MAPATNLNNLIAKHGVNNLQGHTQEPKFMDLSNIPSFHEMQNKVADIQQRFMRLPPQIRSRFHNKVENMGKYLSDPKNNQEAYELGLINDDAIGTYATALHKKQNPQPIKKAEPTPKESSTETPPENG